jgi:hypothetical protein
MRRWNAMEPVLTGDVTAETTVRPRPSARAKKRV